MSFERMPPLAVLTLDAPVEDGDVSAHAANSSLDFLRAVYSDPNQSMHRRMRAAIAALPFEHPKLAVVATFNGGDGFAAKLEAAIARSGKVIECKPLTTAIVASDRLIRD